MSFTVYTLGGKDVTAIVHQNFYFSRDNTFLIPAAEVSRKKYFGEPETGTDLAVTVVIGETNRTFSVGEEVVIETATQRVYAFDYEALEHKLRVLHKSLKLNHGRLHQEFPEQLMSYRFISPKSKVLEIGGNIGRNSVLISKVLSTADNDANLVVLETDPQSCAQLLENRNLNNFRFHIEGSALSKSKLIQKGWDCVQSDVLLPGYNWVNTISLDQLREKYQIPFDTLVLDCEGSFYYILHDFPEIMENIELVIIENDFKDPAHKKYVDDVLDKNNFVNVYSRNLLGHVPAFQYCKPFFFQVWRKRDAYDKK